MPFGPGDGDELLDAVGPVAPPPQQAHDDEAGAGRDALDMKVDRHGVAEAQQIGQTQAREVGRQPRPCGGEAGELGVGGGKDEDVARRLAQIDRRLGVGQRGQLGAQEVQGRPFSSSGRPATTSTTRSAAAAIA